MVSTSSRGLLTVLEEVVYSHSKHIDKCKQLIKRAAHVDSSRLVKGFEGLAKESRRLEEVLLTLSRENLVHDVIEDVEMLSAIVFYVYEVSLEEEKDLWDKYAELVPGENIEEHYARLDKMKILAQKILEFTEGVESK